MSVSLMMRLIPILMVTLFSSIEFALTANLVKRESGQQLMNTLVSGHSLDKRPFCNAFTGCGKKRSISIPNYPNLPSSLAMDESSSASSSPSLSSAPSSPSLSSAASLPILSYYSSPLSIDEPLAASEWLSYLRSTQKLMDEARSWETLQNRINQFGAIEMGQRQRFGLNR